MPDLSQNDPKTPSNSGSSTEMKVVLLLALTIPPFLVFFLMFGLILIGPLITLG